MKEQYGIDMEKTQYSKLVEDIPMPDIAISMGCSDSCPIIGKKYDYNWGIEDPTGKSDDEYFKTIMEIENNITELVVNELFTADY